jgi:hypothetical protein
MIVCIRKEAESTRVASTPMIDQSASPLLALPAELRVAIWSLLLHHDIAHETTLPFHSQYSIVPSTRRDRICANILRTCKQANKEGTPILYGENTFAAHASLLTSLPYFLLRINPTRVVSPAPITSPRVARMIRRYYIHVRLDTDPRFSRAQVSESFTGVEELDIEVFQAMYASCDFSTLSLFEDVRGVGRATVRGSVGDGKYADWLARCMMSGAGQIIPEYSEEYIGGNRAWDAWIHGNR